MRWIVLIGLLLLPMAQAQVLTDPAGDVEARPFGQGEVPVGGWDRVDLLALDLHETPQELHVTVRLEELSEDGPSHDQPSIRVSMRHDEAWYVLQLTHAPDNGAPFAYLHRTSGPDTWGALIASPPTVLDTSEGTFSAAIERHHLVDQDGNPPEQGRALEDLQVVAYAQSTYTGVRTPVAEGGVNVQDRMPDDEDAGRWDFRYGGGTSEGPVALHVENPFRASNGEATTYRMRVHVENHDPEEQAFRLSAPGLPENWELHVAGERLRVSGEGAAGFSVYLSTPFSHQHGSVTAFDLRVERVDDPTVFATREVGVHYHTVAQPAGHHDTLYLHTTQWADLATVLNPLFGGTDGMLSMNTWEEDPADAGTPVRGSSQVLAESQRFSWSACMTPELAMGLDFDLAGEGLLDARFASTLPASDAQLEGRLLWLAPGDEMRFCSPYNYRERDAVVLGDLAPAGLELGPGGEGRVESVFTPASEAERIPFTEGSDLVLELWVDVPVPATGGAGGIDLLPGALLRLPLNEYHEALEFQLPGNGTVDEDEEVFEPETAVKESPAVLLPALVLVAAVAAARRR